MPYSKIIGSILLFTLVPMLHAQNLSDYQWKNRLLFIVDETRETPAMQSQLVLFSQKADELEERDILLFQLTNKEVILSNEEQPILSAEEVFASLSISKNFKGVILVGKDGGVKLKKDFEIPPDAIFSLIDGMPMRKSEMKGKWEN